MIDIEYIENSNNKFGGIIDSEFNKYADKNDLVCNYMPFAFIAKEDEQIIGILMGHSYYNEVHISDFIVFEKYRNKHIGSKLIESAECYFKNKGFENINLTTYEFQAPEFYKKLGFTLEFIRESKTNPKLTKYFFVKYL